MRIKKGDERVDEQERNLAVISQRLSPLIDVSSLQGFGVGLHDRILGINNYAYQANRGYKRRTKEKYAKGA